MAQIDINFGQAGGADNGSSNQFLISVLTKLSNAIEKLNTTTNTATKQSKLNIDQNKPFKGESLQDLVDKIQTAHVNALKTFTNSIGSTLATTVTAAASVTALRYFNNQANAIMGRATASGNFMASAIGGTANQNFGSYSSNLFDIEKTRQIANTNAIAEGAGGTIGAIGGGAISAAIGLIASGGNLAVAGAAMKVGATGGAGIGAGYGDYIAASKYNQYTEQIMLTAAAESRKRADASVSQWQTGFSRWGMKTTLTDIVPAGITHGSAIQSPLQAEFMKKYGASPYFKGIQEGIAPYLSTNPMDSSQGNLGLIAAKFTKAGFAISDFSKLTMQSTQYAAVSGKKLNDFADDIGQARAKFGNAYDTSTNQTALNLMTSGFSKDQAQSLAYQSQFNPGLSGNISMFNNSSYSDFYTRKFMGKTLGFDINQALQGNFTGSESTRKEIAQELINFHKAGGEMGKSLLYGSVLGLSPERMGSLIQNKVAERPLTDDEKQALKNPGLGPGNDAAYKSGTVENLLSRVQNMTVTAQMVTIINGGSMPKGTHSTNRGTYQNMQAEGAPVSMSPSYSPTKP